MRERLEMEKGRRRGTKALDIKYAGGGMLDVYFAVRYLQLRDDVADEGDDRSTAGKFGTPRSKRLLGDCQTMKHFRVVMNCFVRVDHYQRLILGKVATLPSTDHPAFIEIAKRVGFESAA